jgi:hypothetical protein
VYEPYERQTNLYKNGKQTVELIIDKLGYSDYNTNEEEYFSEDITDDEPSVVSNDNQPASDDSVDNKPTSGVSDDNQHTSGDRVEDSSSEANEELESDEEIELEPFALDTESIPEPPSHKETAKMSRYLCHYSDWLAMATISTRGTLAGTPFASIFSYSDGSMDWSSGVPYFYLTSMDMSTQDLLNNPKASVTISLAQNGYCKAHNLDPEDPRCAHVILAGEVVKVQTNSTEEQFAREALFSRHPVMPDWPVGHEWFFAKLNISNIILLDFFGGAIDVPVQEYFDVVL